MRHLLYLAIGLLLSACIVEVAIAQEVLQRRNTSVAAATNRVLDLPSAGLHAFVATWRSGAKPASLRYRVADARGRYGAWRDWSLDNHEPSVEASALLTIAGEATRIEVDVEARRELRLQATSYRAASLHKPGATAALPRRACPCPAPAVVERAAWCPTGDCVAAGTPTALTPEHLVVHHSGASVAGQDYALVVRAIYDFHTGTNGWDDIGYHILVAPDGTVYQGRDTQRQGAHFCGANASTLGVCLLGDYREQALPASALDALARLGSFASCEYDIEPLAESFHEPSGKTLHGVAAHRDGCATACPGDQVVGLLPTLRAAIDARATAGCATVAAPRDLTAATLTDGQVRLNWSAYGGAERVLVERSFADPTNFELVASLDGAAATYRDAGAAGGDNYYRIRVLVDGELSAYSSEVIASVTVSESTPPPGVTPRLVRNPVRGVIEIAGLRAPVDQAFVSDANGRTVYELKGSRPRWSVQPGEFAAGRYWIILFSGNEWFTVPFDYRP